jgi:predicted N-formylglutamate amidohydrolase
MRNFDDEASEKPMFGSDRAAFSVERPSGTSPYLITCDHASRQVPSRLGTLGLSEEDLARHIAWDIGIAGVGRQLAAGLDACVILQSYSRLVIDVNRPPGAPDSIVSRCDGTTIPGNQDLSSLEVARRTREIFAPYHDRIRHEIDDRLRAGRATVLVSLHSFTPTLGGRSRPWHVGVLYQRHVELSHLLLALLRDQPDLVVGDNEPYAASDETDYTIVVHGERRGLPHVELELRQDLIADAAGQGAWAARLVTLLRRAYAIMFPP